MSLAFLTFLNFDKIRDIIILNSIYILISGLKIYLRIPYQILNSPYFEFLTKHKESSSIFNFETSFRFIGELQKPSLETILSIEFSIFISIFCVIGLILWGITHPKNLLV